MLKSIYLTGTDDGTFDPMTEGYEGHSFFCPMTIYTSDVLTTIVYSFDKVRNFKKIAWDGWYEMGFDAISETYQYEHGASGDAEIILFVIPEGETATPANWIPVWKFCQGLILAGGSYDRYQGHPNELRSHRPLSCVHVHPTVIKAEAVAIGTRGSEVGNYEVYLGAYFQQMNLQVWEDDDDYFLGWSIALSNSATGSITSTNNSHDDDWSTYDDTGGGISLPEDIVWTFTQTTLARVRMVIGADSSTPAWTFGAGGTLTAYYMDSGDAWQSFFTWDGTDSQQYQLDSGATGGIWNMPPGGYPGELILFDYKFPTPVTAKALKLALDTGEGITEVRVYDVYAYSGEAKAMTLVGDANTATVAPSEIRGMVVFQDDEAITLNTDLNLFVSRDNGATYTQVQLTQSTQDFDTNQHIATGGVDVSGQPWGMAIKWKITTTAKKIRVRGVTLNWS